jgi:hypothetical protein
MDPFIVVSPFFILGSIWLISPTFVWNVERLRHHMSSTPIAPKPTQAWQVSRIMSGFGWIGIGLFLWYRLAE